MSDKTDATNNQQPIIVGGKIYVICQECHKLVRANKPIFGSIHLCAEEPE